LTHVALDKVDMIALIDNDGLMVLSVLSEFATFTYSDAVDHRLRFLVS